MSAAYEVLRTAPGHLEMTVRNESREAWRASEGFAVGYHLFDVETGTLVVDGARVRPDHDIAPGESMSVVMNFELPPEDGDYRVLVSPMREGVCWYYEKGWPATSPVNTRGSTRASSPRCWSIGSCSPRPPSARGSPSWTPLPSELVKTPV